MPAYFSMHIQRSPEAIPPDYVRRMYAVIQDGGYGFCSGYWPHENAALDEIIAWNQRRLEQGFCPGPSQDGSQDYMQLLFHSPYSELRGFWTHFGHEIGFHLLIPECDVLVREGGDTVLEEPIAPMRALGVRIWRAGLADAIQTSVEVDFGYYSLNRVLAGEALLAHPFAVVRRDTLAKFDPAQFSTRRKVQVGGDGVLLTGDNYLPAHFEEEPD